MPLPPTHGAEHDPVAGVVDELQVEVRVVDGRVAPELVARDVERVRVALRDRQPGLPGGVEDRGRDLGDAAADVFLVLVADDHRRRAEAALERALADAVVEGERGAGRDPRAVEELHREPEVRDPVGAPGVEGRVAREDVR